MSLDDEEPCYKMRMRLDCYDWYQFVELDTYVEQEPETAIE